jgi:hypothetical protein
MGELGRSGADAPSGLRPFGAEPAAQSQAEPLVPNALARELLAQAYEQSTFETMAWTLRNAPRGVLAEVVQVGLDALTEAIRKIAEVDYWEGNCADLIEWRFAQSIEARQRQDRGTRLGPQDESAVAESDAPKASQDTPSPPEDM